MSKKVFKQDERKPELFEFTSHVHLSGTLSNWGFMLFNDVVVPGTRFCFSTNSAKVPEQLSQRRQSAGH